MPYLIEENRIKEYEVGGKKVSLNLKKLNSKVHGLKCIYINQYEKTSSIKYIKLKVKRIYDKNKNYGKDNYIYINELTDETNNAYYINIKLEKYNEKNKFGKKIIENIYNKNNTINLEKINFNLLKTTIHNEKTCIFFEKNNLTDTIKRVSFLDLLNIFKNETLTDKKTLPCFLPSIIYPIDSKEKTTKSNEHTILPIISLDFDLKEQSNNTFFYNEIDQLLKDYSNNILLSYRTISGGYRILFTYKVFDEKSNVLNDITTFEYTYIYDYFEKNFISKYKAKIDNSFKLNIKQISKINYCDPQYIKYNLSCKPIELKIDKNEYKKYEKTKIKNKKNVNTNDIWRELIYPPSISKYFIDEFKKIFEDEKKYKIFIKENYEYYSLKRHWYFLANLVRYCYPREEAKSKFIQISRELGNYSNDQNCIYCIEKTIGYKFTLRIEAMKSFLIKNKIIYSNSYKNIDYLNTYFIKHEKSKLLKIAETNINSLCKNYNINNFITNKKSEQISIKKFWETLRLSNLHKGLYVSIARELKNFIIESLKKVGIKFTRTKINIKNSNKTLNIINYVLKINLNSNEIKNIKTKNIEKEKIVRKDKKTLPFILQKVIIKKRFLDKINFLVYYNYKIRQLDFKIQT